MASNTESKYISCHPHSTIFSNESQRIFSHQQTRKPSKSLWSFIFCISFTVNFYNRFGNFFLGMVKRKKSLFFVCLFFSSVVVVQIFRWFAWKTWRKFCIHQGHGTKENICAFKIENLIEVLWVFFALQKVENPLLPASINKHQTQQQSMRKYSPKKRIFLLRLLDAKKNISHHHYLNPTFSILTLIYSLFPSVFHAPLQCMFATGFSRIFASVFTYATYFLGNWIKNLQENEMENQSLKNKST